MTEIPTEGEIRARMQWAALYARAEKERRAALAQRFAAPAAILIAGAALGLILGIAIDRAITNCAATILQAEDRGPESW